MLQWGKKMIEPSKSNLSESVHNEYPIEASNIVVTSELREGGSTNFYIERVCLGV